jgi:hypothetical protein
MYIQYCCTCQIVMELEFFNIFFLNSQISDFMKICPVGAELFHV